MIKKTGSTGLSAKFISYPAAMSLLSEVLTEAPTLAELAAWVFIGPESGGLAAYTNANELDPPPRFYFNHDMGDDYIAPLMACWFRYDDIKKFKANERFITWKTLTERWGKLLEGQPDAFIRAKISESSLIDIHPITGGTRGTFPGFESFPPIEVGLFQLSQVNEIEAEELGVGRTVQEKATATQKQGVSASDIRKYFKLWDDNRWKRLLSKPPKWLEEARIRPVVHRVAARWNPATVALCLWSYREKKAAVTARCCRRTCTAFRQRKTSQESFRRISLSGLKSFVLTWTDLPKPN